MHCVQFDILYSGSCKSLLTKQALINSTYPNLVFCVCFITTHALWVVYRISSWLDSQQKHHYSHSVKVDKATKYTLRNSSLEEKIQCTSIDTYSTNSELEAKLQYLYEDKFLCILCLKNHLLDLASNVLFIMIWFDWVTLNMISIVN